MNGNCPICERLWKEFTEATKAHTEILGKFELAEMEQRSTVLSELEPLKLATAERRVQARMALRKHAATHHDGKAKSQTSHGS